jgi:hypothetical protein
MTHRSSGRADRDVRLSDRTVLFATRHQNSPRTSLFVFACAVALATVACNQDLVSPARRLTVSDPKHVATLVGGPLPIYAARTNADSADVPVVLGVLRISAHAGDSLQLLLRANAQMIRAIGTSHVLVSDGQTTTDITVQDMLRGSWRYRVDPSASELRISLERRADAPIVDSLWKKQLTSGSVSLIATTSAVIASARTPWMPKSATASAVEVPGSSCEAVLEEATCGEMTYHIDPYVDNGAGYFQSDWGTGASNQITMTFTGPVHYVSITINDPTWSGNTVTLYDSLNHVIAADSFAYSGQAGVDVPNTKVFDVPDSVTIARAVLTPAADDYVFYYVSVNAAPAPGPGSVTCTPTTLVRGDSITCHASGFSTSPIWRFVEDGANIAAVESDVSDSVWGGRMVVSGTIWAGGRIGSHVDTTPVHIEVTPRTNWNSTQTVPISVREVSPGDLVDTAANKRWDLREKPTAKDGQLGVTLHWIDYRDGWLDSAVKVVSGGPNDGYVYLSSIPFVVKDDVAINRVAMAVGSAWYNLQATSSPTLVYGTPACLRSKVPVMLDGVIAHEGLNQEANSHVKLYYDRAASILKPGTENIVRYGDITKLLDQVKTAANRAADSVSQAMDHSSINVLNHAPYNTCNFAYFKP